MDLRPLTPSREQLDRARDLAVRGLLVYQPFILSDRLEVGVGREAAGVEGSGMVYCPDIPIGTSRFLIEEGNKDDFSTKNAQLRTLYEHFADSLLGELPDPRGLTFGEIGCNSGYFPLAMARRGFRRAIGFDAENYDQTFALLRDITGQDFEFINHAYDLQRRTLPWAPQVDVMMSVAVLCHLSEPLQHLTFLGAMARKALLVWAPIVQGDTEMTIRFDSANRYYKDAAFPYNFDFVRMSAPLIRNAMAWMGFRVIELRNCRGGMTDEWFSQHLAIIGIRD